MSVLPDDRQYLPNNPPVGGCTCRCHYTPGVVHFMACCGRGGIKEATDAIRALQSPRASDEVVAVEAETYRHMHDIATRDLGYPSILEALEATPPAKSSDEVLAEEYMTVTLSRDGTVTSHNAFDADFDEMVVATQTIVDVLTKRLSDRKFCPYSHGGALRTKASDEVLGEAGGACDCAGCGGFGHVWQGCPRNAANGVRASPVPVDASGADWISRNREKLLASATLGARPSVLAEDIDWIRHRQWVRELEAALHTAPVADAQAGEGK